jgi:DNA repair protein RecN (Recombination protein N)
MLTHLSIRNFALIDRADIDFQKGFLVITGETGSGKSILLGALNLILGERADYSVIRDETTKTVVEAHFMLDKRFQHWFVSNELDWDENTIIRREILAHGKSRSFINDSPVQLTVLKELTEQLIYIHSQHQTLAIKKSDFQFDLIDSFGDNLENVAHYKSSFQQLTKQERLLVALNERNSEEQKEIAFVSFQLEELNQVALSKHDFQAYEKELEKVNKLDELRAAFTTISAVINDESGVASKLSLLKQQLDKWRTLDDSFSEFHERIQSTLIELVDIADESEKQLSDLELDPKRIEFLQTQLNGFYLLLKKHQLTTQDELIALEKSLADKVLSSSNTADEIEKISAELIQLREEVKKQAQGMNAVRFETTTKLSTALQSILQHLKLADARVSFELQQLPQLDSNGGLTISCLFSANKGIEQKPIEKVASGGELSRLMLAIQSIISQKKALPTLILDEIDTGVSGEVALRIGQLLRQMGSKMQLLAITHLPQVAALGAVHYEVKKSVENESTITAICLLNETERIDALAKLLSGEQITAVSRENAKALMQAKD